MAGDAEVEQLGDFVLIARDQENVVGLQVAMNDSDAVRAHERTSDLSDDAIGLFGFEPRSPRETFAQILALQELHDDERNSVPDSVLEHVDDVRAANLRGRPRLAFGAHPELSCIRALAVDQLDSAKAVEQEIVREPNTSNTA